MPLKTNTTKTCQRCGTKFVCGVNSISNCFCYTIVVSQKAKQVIKQNFSDCICKNCLTHFSKL